MLCYFYKHLYVFVLFSGSQADQRAVGYTSSHFLLGCHVSFSCLFGCHVSFSCLLGCHVSFSCFFVSSLFSLPFFDTNCFL